MRLPIELPSLESLPQAVCRLCHRSLILGLYTPGELKMSEADGRQPRCCLCIGEINSKTRAKHTLVGL